MNPTHENVKALPVEEQAMVHLAAAKKRRPTLSEEDTERIFGHLLTEGITE